MSEENKNEEKKFKEKYGFNLSEMQLPQAIDWMDSVLKSTALGSLELAVYPRILERFANIMLKNERKLAKQDKVINFVLEGTKLSGKDKAELVKILLE